MLGDVKINLENGLNLNRILEEINSDLKKEMVTFMEDLPQDVSEVISYLFYQGGKRIRPLLFSIFVRVLDTTQDITPFSLSIELIHTMSLYHDDVLDGAEERRGSPSVHKRWDVPTAIIGGDILHSQIHKYLIKAIMKGRISSNHGLKFLELLTDVEVEIGTNVLREMRVSKAASIPDYKTLLEISASKTAPLFALSGQAAAIISGNENLASNLKSFGRYFGIAYQLLDDLLDYFPSNKDMGGDLREGKKTPLMGLIANSHPEDLNRYLGRSDLTDEDIQLFRSRYKKYFYKVIELIDTQIQSAKAEVQQTPVYGTVVPFIQLLYKKIEEIKNSLKSN